MNKLIHKMRNRKGFTLIELIVVIAILGILAAILVPSMMTFIGDSREAALKANCRTLVTGAAAYAAKKMSTDSAYAGGDMSKATAADVTALTPYIGTPSATAWTVSINGDGTVTGATYAEGGKTCTYDGSTYEVE
jgi:prepilin-type N-terminal cleavage/methylation domain-containing protein